MYCTRLRPAQRHRSPSAKTSPKWPPRISTSEVNSISASDRPTQLSSPSFHIPLFQHCIASLPRLESLTEQRHVLIEVVHHLVIERQEFVRLQIGRGDIGSRRDPPAGADRLHARS